MRIIKELNHPIARITFFYWNGKYLIKLEQDNLEQTFKVSELDIINEQEVFDMINEDFMMAAQKRFKDMGRALQKALS